MRSDTSPALNDDLAAYRDYALRLAGHILMTFGPRGPGSPGERAAQEHLRDELAQYADEVRVEPFFVHPWALMAWIPILAALATLATVAYWFAPWVSVACVALGIFILILQFGMYKQLLDPFLPRKESCNVLGMRKPSAPAKRRIILSGHTDAAFEMRYNRKSVHVLRAVVVLSVLGTLFVLGTSLVCAVDGASPPVFGVLNFAWLPVFLPLALFTNYARVVPGANDNLSGVCIVLAAAKFLKDQDLRFRDTEVWFLLTGSEEAGLRGAKAFAKRHKGEWKAVETHFLALDTLRDLDHFSVAHRDLNGTVRHDPALCDLVVRAAEKRGITLKRQSVYIGSSDATAFTQAGVPACALVAMDPEPPRYYHTRLDDFDCMNGACLEAGLGVILETIRMYDAQGGAVVDA